MSSSSQPPEYEKELLPDTTTTYDYREETRKNKLIVKMNFLKKIQLKTFGSAFLCNYQKDGWKKPLPMFVFQCKQHGVQIGHPAGWKESLVCPKCFHDKLAY